MYNPLRYIDPSGWVISRPERNGILPPPDGSDFDNYVPGRITSYGFSTEYNAYTYSYNIHEATVTASRYTWAEQWCRDYTWNRRGQYSSEYSGGEVYISPTTNSGGGGGGGNGGSAIVPIQTAITVDGIVIANNISYYEKYPSEIKDLGAKIKLRLKTGDPLKKASTQKIGERAVGRMQIANKALGATGIALSVIDIYTSGEINVSNGFYAGVAVLSAFPGAGWIIGGMALTLDIAFYSYTGESFGDNLSHWFGDPSYKFRE